MRCSECDGIVREQSVGRLRDGRIVFGWCTSCMDVAGATRIEITDRVRLFGTGEKVALPLGGTAWDHEEARSRKRLLALTITAVSLGFWGLTLTIAGFAKDDEPSPANPQGSRIGLFLVGSGGSMMGTALGLYLAARKARGRHGPRRDVALRPASNPQKSETAL
ncbi:hypothetical protein GC170_14090 [bacterium]|nr:hypothetical protein [bacterium]